MSKHHTSKNCIRALIVYKWSTASLCDIIYYVFILSRVVSYRKREQTLSAYELYYFNRISLATIYTDQEVVTAKNRTETWVSGQKAQLKSTMYNLRAKLDQFSLLSKNRKKQEVV